MFPACNSYNTGNQNPFTYDMFIRRTILASLYLLLCSYLSSYFYILLSQLSPNSVGKDYGLEPATLLLHVFCVENYFFLYGAASAIQKFRSQQRLLHCKLLVIVVVLLMITKLCRCRFQRFALWILDEDLQGSIPGRTNLRNKFF